MTLKDNRLKLFCSWITTNEEIYASGGLQIAQIEKIGRFNSNCVGKHRQKSSNSTLRSHPLDNLLLFVRPRFLISAKFDVLCHDVPAIHSNYNHVHIACNSSLCSTTAARPSEVDKNTRSARAHHASGVQPAPSWMLMSTSWSMR